MSAEPRGRITIPRPTKEEEPFEQSLRPQSLQEFVGQEQLKRNLSVFIQAALGRKDALDHCLFSAPPGLGKTTLAHIIAKEMGVSLRNTSGPVLERKGDLAAILTSLSPGDVFFIDEIHRLSRVIEETLYSVMEDFKLDIIIGEGPSAKTISLSIPRFTLVGATTRVGLLTSPLRNRFGIVGHLKYYSVEELRQIVHRSSQILEIEIDQSGAMEIARRSRGTPRVANRLLRRLRDFAQVRGAKVITQREADEALAALEVDQEGLDALDRRLLTTLIEKFGGGPVGVETLAVSLSEDVETLTDVCEPFLIQCGLLARTPRGRIATERAYVHTKLTRGMSSAQGTSPHPQGQLL
ncbi:MAG: Holliday junction branch migration DNA helicase RuvB [Elusimicrobia bacterium]|nr:Holliday junction branch migration DNA helicase RuvB [Elusimicrobiota bacterium]